MSKEQVEVIAIDGPTASGKGTIAGIVAQRLGYHYLDSGALYRLAALTCLDRQVDLSDEAACAKVASDIEPIFRDGRIELFGRDVTEAIRAEVVGITASKIATLPDVRQALFDLQRRAKKAPGLVADGRDMASVVFPDARLKVFLTASAESRAERRYRQLIQKGISANLTSLTEDLAERDRRDRERKTAPLVPMPDSRILDSSNLTIEETVETVLTWWREVNQ